MTVQHCALRPCKDLYFPLQVEKQSLSVTWLSQVHTAQINQTPASGMPKPSLLNPKSQSPQPQNEWASAQPEQWFSLSGVLGGPSLQFCSFHSRERIATSMERGLEKAPRHCHTSLSAVTAPSLGLGSVQNGGWDGVITCSTLYLFYEGHRRLIPPPHPLFIPFCSRPCPL